MDLVFRFAKRITVDGREGARLLNRRHAGRDRRRRQAACAPVYLGREGIGVPCLSPSPAKTGALSPRRCDRRLRRGRSWLDGRVVRGSPPARPLALLGRNGVGKTTLLGDHHGPHAACHKGAIALDGAPDRPPRRRTWRARAGLGLRAPGARDLFRPLTVLENLQGPPSGPGRLDRPTRVCRAVSPRLASAPTTAATQLLRAGEQQMLAIGRALMGNPTILLLDEPLEGPGPNHRREPDGGAHPAARGTRA